MASVVRREIDSQAKRKYSLSKAPSDTSTKRLAFMQAQRYWVERPFQDAKNQCGKGDIRPMLACMASPYVNGDAGDVVYVGATFTESD